MNKTLTLLFIALLTGCASLEVEILPDSNDELATLETLRGDVRDIEDDDDNDTIRLDALKDTARSLGARSGLAFRGEEINESLYQEEEQLDRIFNFHALLLSDNILPPVLVEGRDSLTVNTPNVLRVADRNYKIIKQARFVTLAPTWRDYLIMDDTRPPLPDKSLWPKTDEEREIWADYVEKGWFEGIYQADQIYTENLARLKRDYQGMVRYRMLLAQNMVSAPQVSHRSLGVTGGGEELAINDRTLTIEALPALRADSETWAPLVTTHE
ncbi:MAG: type IV secretory system conjugative DNA transfer family protein [Legionellales bacterium]|jgi:defect-in-organelle-trafficking protein DotC